MGLLVTEFKDRWNVSRGDDEQVGDPALLAGDQDCGIVVAMEDGVGPGTAQVVAEGAGIGVGDLEVAHDDFLNERRKS